VFRFDGVLRLAEKWKISEHVFCLVVGGIYLYAVLRAIFGATFIETAGFELYFIGILALVAMMFVLFNYITRIVVSVLAVTIGFFVLATWENFYEWYEHFFEVFLMVTGRIPYSPQLAPTVVWTLAILLAFAIVVFTVHCFNFYVFAAGGAATFMFTWMPGFSRDEGAFLLFFAAICMIFLRKANKSMSAVFAAAPLCVAVILFAQFIVPAESALFERRHIGETRRLNDFFHELLNPTHFSFQQTGFSGPGGRLGGPVTPNYRYVMSVVAPGRTYLAGAISNEYTGDRWLRTLRDGDIYTHGLLSGRFEMLETAAALIRGATRADLRDEIHADSLGLPQAEAGRINMRDFSVLGVSETADFHRVAGGWGFEFDAALVESIAEALGVDEVTFAPSVNVTWESASETYYLHTYMPYALAEIWQAPGSRTGTIFRPPRAVAMWFNEDSPDYSDAVEILPTGDMQTPGFMSRGAAYGIQFLNVDTNLSFIEEILRGAGEGVYQARAPQDFPTFAGCGNIHGTAVRTLILDEGVWWDAHSPQFEPLPDAPISAAEFASLLGIYTPRDVRIPPRYITDTGHLMRLLDSFSQDVLAQYAREVRQHFLAVPEITPPRVHELTYEITRDAQNDFERVAAIREFLLQFPYTLEPAPVPRGVCFVDWFLFEGREGYCTYFASAMAVMSRIAGVPSRYVEGFVLPPAADPDLPVRVSNRMAHAWVEVYLEGFGWHIIEATPTYAFLLNPDAPYDAETAPGAGFTNPYWVDRMQELMPDFMPPEGAPDGFTAPPPPAPSDFEDEPEPRFLSPQRVGIWIVTAAILTAIIALAAYVLRTKLTLRRIKKLPPGERVKIYFRATLSVVAYFTSHPLPDETEKLYGLRTGKRFAYKSDSVFFRDLITLYYKAKFSPHEISPAEADLMRDAHADMLSLLRQLRWRYVYLYLRHVRGVGRVRG